MEENINLNLEKNYNKLIKYSIKQLDKIIELITSWEISISTFTTPKNIKNYFENNQWWKSKPANDNFDNEEYNDADYNDNYNDADIITLALKWFNLSIDTLTKESLKKQYKIYVLKYHPDSSINKNNIKGDEIYKTNKYNDLLKEHFKL